MPTRRTPQTTPKTPRAAARRAKKTSDAAEPATTLLRPGPRKQRSTAPKLPRITRHKNRAAWFRARVTWPLREAPIEKLKAEQRRAARTLAAVPITWQLAGPTNIGGRCTSIVCDPGNPARLWIGAAGGGVWRSSDAGLTWKYAWRANTPLQIGALAIDPSNPKTLYAGTGEANLSLDSYPGDGIYRSSNGGRSWKPWATASRGLPRRVGSIAVDPFDSNHVLVGGVGYGRVSSDNDFGGLYSTSDGGVSWARASFVSSANYWCHAVVFDPAIRGTVFATVTGPGAKSGIWRSTDGGQNWVQLKSGLPPPERIARTTLAIAPSNSKIVYAVCADAGPGNSDGVLGVYRSRNGGNTWVNIARSHFADEGQMSYGNTIAVHPTNPNHVLCGGVDLHLTTNGGTSWQLASHWDAPRGGPAYAHADHHQLLMPAAAPGRVYSANDGGLDVSEDGGKHWANRSKGLAVTMYYDVDVAQTDVRLFGGGAQDNGTLITTTGASDDAFELLGGDGGWMVVDPREAGHIYASYQFGAMYRFRNGSSRKVSPPFKPSESGGMWMVYIAFDPNHPDTVYTGNQCVYRTRNDGLSWDKLTPVLDGSPISAIEVAGASSKNLYIGTENGGFFRSLDGGATWSANLASGTLPGVMITRIAAQPGAPNTVFVTVANSGNSHVFRSSDAGATWTDIDAGKLPDVPHHALLVRPDKPAELCVCNDAGVYLTSDSGLTWRNASGKLPAVMVVDLVYHRKSKTLLAATYGRSLWKAVLG
jgi:photosystem II stability/assembly factor-like uncharacterized protein